MVNDVAEQELVCLRKIDKVHSSPVNSSQAGECCHDDGIPAVLNDDNRDFGIPSTSEYNPPKPCNKFFLEITAFIRSFLSNQARNVCTKKYEEDTSIDFDELLLLVNKYNAACKKKEDKVILNKLVEGAMIVERRVINADYLDKLSDLERLRLKSAERKYKASVKNVICEDSANADIFVDYRHSLALVVNALMGIFLTFLAGYWVTEYSGVKSVKTKFVAGLISSFVCLLVEVALFVLYDDALQWKKARREKENKRRARKQDEGTKQIFKYVLEKDNTDQLMQSKYACHDNIKPELRKRK